MEAIYKRESGKAIATLTRILGDLDLAEEYLQAAFLKALETWPDRGVPDNPCAWLISTAKHRAIDAFRRAKRGDALLQAMDPQEADDWELRDDYWVEDDQLRLIFYCCHPILGTDAQIPLALKEVAGMSTAAIAQAFLMTPEAMKRKISRAKKKIKDHQVPYEIPSREDRATRIAGVLHAIYLIYNEGYSKSSGESLTQKDLTDEAVVLMKTLLSIEPSAEGMGLLALFLFHESKSMTRVDSGGCPVQLEDQDRSLWDQAMIAEGLDLLHKAVMTGRLGPYGLQAAMASVHCVAPTFAETQWRLIVGYYDMLFGITPSPIVRMNRAIALGMAEGPEAGLRELRELTGAKQIAQNHRLYAAIGEFSFKVGNRLEAEAAFRKALELAPTTAERLFLQQKLQDLA